MTRKLVVNDGRTERELLLTGTICVGRDASCHIHELDPLLSRRHAEFVWQKDRVTIRDLASRNGILVNGLKVPEKVLVSGDVVQLGSLHFRYVEEERVLAPEERARSRERTDAAIETPTMAPAAARVAAQLDTRKAPLPTGADLDATFAPGAAVNTDLDATFAPAGGDLDATFAPAHDPDATFAPGSLALSPDPGAAVVAPSAGSRAEASGFDATIAPVRRPADGPGKRPGDATLVVDRHMTVTAASPECVDLFGVGPETLVGNSIGEVVMQTLGGVASGNRPAALSIQVVRTPADRTITLTFKAGQAVETVS
jgi:pSer/pThr/pTyr-binding forkhead associated (FHA) protein